MSREWTDARSGLLPFYSFLRSVKHDRPNGNLFSPFCPPRRGLATSSFIPVTGQLPAEARRRYDTPTHPSDDNPDYCQRIAKIPAVPPRILDHMCRSRSSNPGTVKTGKLSNRRPARETIGEAPSRCSSCDRLNAESLAPPRI